MIIDLERGPAVDDQAAWLQVEAAKAALLREMVVLTTIPPVLPSDITARDFAAAADNLATSTARDRLNALVRAGKLTSPEGLCYDPVTHRCVRVWRAVEE